MCAFNVPITQVNANRAVMCCQSNSIHLTWDFVTLRLTYGEFARLVQQVERTRVAIYDGFFDDNMPVEESVAVACHSFSFTLAQPDYLQFAQLVTRAFEKLNGRAPRVFALQHGSHPLTDAPLSYEFLAN